MGTQAGLPIDAVVVLVSLLLPGLGIGYTGILPTPFNLRNQLLNRPGVLYVALR